MRHVLHLYQKMQKSNFKNKPCQSRKQKIAKGNIINGEITAKSTTRNSTETHVQGKKQNDRHVRYIVLVTTHKMSEYFIVNSGEICIRCSYLQLYKILRCGKKLPQEIVIKILWSFEPQYSWAPLRGIIPRVLASAFTTARDKYITKEFIYTNIQAYRAAYHEGDCLKKSLKRKLEMYYKWCT